MTMSTDLPEPASTELNRLLADWATSKRLSNIDAARIRAAVLISETGFDADWLWSLLRPVTALLENEFSGRSPRQWPFSSDDERTYVAYLQLA